MNLDQWFKSLPSEFCNHWRRKCLIDAPAGLQSTQETSSMETKPSSPLLDPQPLSAVLKPYLVLAVLSLLNWCHPPAISRFIVSGVIFATKLVLHGWPLANIAKKIKKPISSAPSLAYGHTTSPVEAIAMVLRAVASLDHAIPDYPLRSSSESVNNRLPSSLRGNLLAKASTAVCVPPKVRCQPLYRSSAVAYTLPPERSGAGDWLKNNEPSKSLALYV